MSSNPADDVTSASLSASISDGLHSTDCVRQTARLLLSQTVNQPRRCPPVVGAPSQYRPSVCGSPSISPQRTDRRPAEDPGPAGGPPSPTVAPSSQHTGQRPPDTHERGRSHGAHVMNWNTQDVMRQTPGRKGTQSERCYPVFFVSSFQDSRDLTGKRFSFCFCVTNIWMGNETQDKYKSRVQQRISYTQHQGVRRAEPVRPPVRHRCCHLSATGAATYRLNSPGVWRGSPAARPAC